MGKLIAGAPDAMLRMTCSRRLILHAPTVDDLVGFARRRHDIARIKKRHIDQRALDLRVDSTGRITAALLSRIDNVPSSAKLKCPPKLTSRGGRVGKDSHECEGAPPRLFPLRQRDAELMGQATRLMADGRGADLLRLLNRSSSVASESCSDAARSPKRASE